VYVIWDMCVRYNWMIERINMRCGWWWWSWWWRLC